MTRRRFWRQGSFDEEDGASGDFTVGIAAGCMSVEASVAVVVN